MHKAVIIGATSVVSLAVGSVGGYLFAKKRLEEKYAQQANDEIKLFYQEHSDKSIEVAFAELENLHNRVNKKGPFSTPESAARALISEDEMEALGKQYRVAATKTPPDPDSYEYEEGEEEGGDEGDEADIFDPEDTLYGQNVPVQRDATTEEIFVNGMRFRRRDFTNLPPEEKTALHEEAVTALKTYRETQEVEMVVKNIFKTDPRKAAINIGGGEVPYVISADEFLARENEEFNQVTLTYYEGDKVLTDERDQPIQDVDDMVGEHNLLRFGDRSQDRNVVYIRNEELSLEIELVRSTGTYAEEVLGEGGIKGREVRSHRG